MKALVKNLTFVLLGSVVTFNIHAQNPDRIITPYEIEQGQNKAVELYEDGKYEEAFEESSIAAQRGMKTAQYLLGIMFLKGEYVQQSLPIGMAWLGVASEADQDDWHATYKQVYDSLPANAQAAIDAKVSTYIDLYGLKAQKVRCVKRARTGQRRIEEICEKNGSITPLYSLEGVPENFTSRIGTCDEPWPCQFGTLRLDLENVNLRDLGPF